MQEKAKAKNTYLRISHLQPFTAVFHGQGKKHTLRES